MTLFAIGLGPLNPINAVSDALGWIVGKAGEVVAGTVEGAFAYLASWILDGTFWIVNLVFDAVFAVSSPQLTAAWFSGGDGPYQLMFRIGVSLLLGAVFIGVLRGTLTGDVGGMTRRFVLGLPTVALVMTTTVVFTQVAVDIVDELSDWLWAQGGSNTEDFLTNLVAVGEAMGQPEVVASFAVIIPALFLMLAALLVFLVLIVRSALIYLLVALVPLAVLALVTGHRQAFTRTMEMLVAFTVAKLVVVLALVLGTAALSGVTDGDPNTTALGAPPVVAGPDGEPIQLISQVDDACEVDCDVNSDGLAQAIGAMLVGVTAFGLGVFSPWMLMRLMPGAEPTQTAHPGTGGVMNFAYTARTVRSRGGPNPTGAARSPGGPAGRRPAPATRT